MRGLVTGSILMAACISCTPFSFPSRGAMEQPPISAAADTAQMREALADVLAGDFDIVRTELRTAPPHHSGTYWLVHARPRRSGDYQLAYRYIYRNRPESAQYTHAEHTAYVRVGERGCWRRRERRDLCLGDVVIVPIPADHSGYAFELTRRAPWVGTASEPHAAAPGADTLPNPLSPHLRYLGHEAEERPFRSGGSTTALYARFMAQAPGIFNLSLRRHDPGAPQARPQTEGSVPVVIVPRGAPVTVLLDYEDAHYVDAVRGISSQSSKHYRTDVLVLQPGDEISLSYDGFTTRPQRGAALSSNPRPDQPRIGPPSITRLPFQLDTAAVFNAWIVDHLPATPSSPR